jgi:peptide/nickel transport system substrate-binding protein
VDERAGRWVAPWGAEMFLMVTSCDGTGRRKSGFVDWRGRARPGGWSVFAVSADGDCYQDPTVVPAIRANGRDAWIGWPDSPKIEALFHDWFLAGDQHGRKAIARELQLQTLSDVTWIPLAQVFLPTVMRDNIAGVLPGFIKCWNVQRV